MPNTGSYSWTVPDTPSATCRVRISDVADNSVFDWSDLVFSIVPFATKPTVTTSNISSITPYSAFSGGNVISDGGASVTARGVCWNTLPNPTTGNSKTINGSGIGSFTSEITGLAPNTTYYVRAYATNSYGTSYGIEKSFTALSASTPYYLNVTSTPVTGVSINVNPKDNNNLGDGSTQFYRTYNYGTIVTLTAPVIHNGRHFVKWLIDGEIYTNQTINITMGNNHTAQAVFQSLTYTLSVQSSPNPGVNISVTPVDNNGDGDGTTNFTRTYNTGTIVTLTAPQSFENSNFFKWSVDGKSYTDRIIQVIMDGNHTAAAFYETLKPPEIGVNRAELDMGYIVGSSIQPTETIAVFNSGGGTLDWTVSTEFRYFDLAPSSGTNCGEVILTVVDADELNPGDYDGFINVSAPLADNSPQTIKINLWVRTAADSGPPFGTFETPIDGSTVRSSIPVTGWVLSDTGMESVKIYREEGKKLVYIGDAYFVEGARPDVEAAYPGYPMNYKAGWGYMMLTNFLPPGGNGVFKIHAIATDRESRTTTLGIKTITVNNFNAVKPFGAIDTPIQGGEATGSDFVNWGWVLTPQPNSVPIDGSTINVYIDGVNLGHPIYNIYRSDIADLFPGYVNSEGAVGYFYLDTTAYDDGIHTIQWTAADSAGNTDGIGSRYFTINNTCGTSTSQAANLAKHLTDSFPLSSLTEIPANHFKPVGIKKGSLRDTAPEIIYPDDNAIINIEIKELEPIVICLDICPDSQEYSGKYDSPNTSFIHGFLVAGKDKLKPLPIGSTLDKKRGIFYWLPGPGFFGKYRLMFIETGPGDEIEKREILVNIEPKFNTK